MHYPGATSITVVFDEFSFTESGFDYVYIMDGAGNVIAKLSSNFAKWRYTINDDTIQIRLTSDTGGSRYGYKFSLITAEIPAHTEHAVSEVLPACTVPGYTSGVICDVCGQILAGCQELPALEHSYSDGYCTICGESDKFDIAVARMILGNALKFQFGIDRSARSDWTGAYAAVEKTWADGSVTTNTVPFSEWEIAGPYYAIVYDGLAAKEMADSFHITVFDGEGRAISNSKTDSVRDYVERAFAAQSKEGQIMMVDMLNYGAAAQQKFNYNESDPANNRLTDLQKNVGTKSVTELKNRQVKGTNYLGTRLTLESRIQIQVAFKGLSSDMYAIYSYRDQTGKLQNIRVNGDDFVSAGDVKGIELNKLVYADARTLVAVTVYNSDGSEYGSAQDSIESCAKRSTSGDDVFIALMKFADSARNYLY